MMLAQKLQNCISKRLCLARIRIQQIADSLNRFDGDIHLMWFGRPDFRNQFGNEFRRVLMMNILLKNTLDLIRVFSGNLFHT